MRILAIDTSCDETSVAVTEERKIISNVIFSQVLLHKKWGGVVPSLAKRAHIERIDEVVDEALKRARIQKDEIEKHIDFVAVTYGPGLAPALEVGIQKAKELALLYGKPLIPVHHMEGHIYSCFAQNSKGNPPRIFHFPYLALLVSGGHTELVFFKDHVKYEVIGETVDDAAGEALDKAAKMLGLGYPGGAAIERLSHKGNPSCFVFPRPLAHSSTLDFSFSGLKTAFYYHLKKQSPQYISKHVYDLAASFQEAVFDSILHKLTRAITKTGISQILMAGGVAANQTLRKKIRRLVASHKGKVLSPPFNSLYGDNAAMIGIAGSYRAEYHLFVEKIDALDRIARMSLNEVSRK